MPETTVRVQACAAIAQARQCRAHEVRAAAWLRTVWGDDDAVPAFNWAALADLPCWAMGTAHQLERLALLTGALFAAPALRMCLDAGPLMRVRALIGAPALDRVLALSDQPMQSPEWPTDESSERNTMYTWGAALLTVTVTNPFLQATLVRALALSPSLLRHGLPPLPLAMHMTTMAHEITAALSAFEPSQTQPEAA